MALASSTTCWQRVYSSLSKPNCNTLMQQCVLPHRPVRCNRHTLCAMGPLHGRDAVRESRQVVHYKQAADVETESKYLRLDYDCTELLDLHGRESYLFCDITRAYDDLLAATLTEGYSQDVYEGRQDLLDYIKGQALYHEGRVQRGKGIDVPVHLLPSALALLAQINQNAIVFALAPKLLENWDMRRTHKRDLILSLAVARCNVARDLLADQKVAQGCCELEEALSLLNSNDPPLAPSLAADIQEAVAGMAVQRILDQLRGPMTPETAPARRKAVAMLKDLLSTNKGSGQRHTKGHGLFERAVAVPSAAGSGAAGVAGAAGNIVNADYIRLVVDCMASHELVGMANWEQVARNVHCTSWLYPGLLQIAATAHIAVGFTGGHPSLLRPGLALLRAAPQSCEVLLLRGISSVLLGELQLAVEFIRAAAKAPLDEHISWPHGATAAADSHKDTLSDGAPQLPAGPDAYSFLVAHSAAEDTELLTGLCQYTELFLGKVVFAGFPDTSHLQGPISSLPAYFDSPHVQQELEDDKQRNSSSITGSLAAITDAVNSVQPLVHQLAATARSAGSKLAEMRMGIGGDDRVVSNRFGVTGRHEAHTAAADTLGGDKTDSWQDQHIAGWDNSRSNSPDLAHGQQDGSSRHGTIAKLTAACNQVLSVLEQHLGGSRPAAIAAAAALAAAITGAVVIRTRPTTEPQQQQYMAVVEGASAVVAKPLGMSEALRLVKHFQQAKAAALGSDFDDSKLSSVCVGQALSNFLGMSKDFAAQGWFRTANVYKVEVQRIEPRSSSGLHKAVIVRVGETASTWGIDGRQGSSWSNEYDVEYDVVLCRDMQWRIQGVHVRGQEPGMPAWFGAHMIGKLFKGNASS